MNARIAAALGGLVVVSSAAVAQQSSTSDQNEERLPTVSVTGTAIPRADLETPSPVIVMTREDIKRSGLTTVTDVIRSISADNSGTIPTSFTAGFAAGASGVALRGLTVNSTLVLIDGRRAASYPVSDDGQRSFVDLNTIPLESVERIEVLKDGASSLYGADAIAGVVNVILRHDYQGLSGTAEVGNSQHGGGFEKRLTGSFGRGDLHSDHYNAYVGFEYENDNRILTSQRDFPFNTTDLSSIGGNNLLVGQPSQFTGSIYGSVIPGTLSRPGDLTSGVPLPGALFQPLRPCGPGSTLVNDSTGSYCTQNPGQYTDVQPSQERLGVNGRFTVQLSDYTEAYLNASYFQNKVFVDSFFATGPAQIQVATPHNTDSIALPPTLPNGQLNPNNPFAAQGQYALINYAFGDLPGSSAFTNHAIRAVAGIKGTWGDWNYDSALVIDHTWLDTAYTGLLNYNALIDAITNGTYNFIDPSQNSAAIRNTLSPRISKTSTSDLDSLDLRVNRTLWPLPGGPLGLALGAEVRHEAQDDPELNPGLVYQGLGTAHTIGSRNVQALYAEISAPLLNALEFDASARFDHYSDFGRAFDPKVGFKWTPWEPLAIRGTYSRGFRAPSFSESAQSAAEGFVTYTIKDPAFLAAHNNNGYTAPYPLAEFSTANPNVRPERSNSWTLGAIYQPFHWLNASLDYYAIRKDAVIVPPNTNIALAAYFAGQPIPPGYSVTPDVPDPEFPNALPRPIVVAAPYINANSLRTSGVDLDLRANFDLPWWGLHFVSDLTATKIFNWTMHFPDGSAQHYVGTQGPYALSSGAGTPRYRAGWANTLSGGPWSATATIYYTSGLFMSAPDFAGEGVCFSTDPTGANFPPSCRMSSFTDVDLTGSYNINEHIQLTGAILNLFDREPPLDPINYASFFNYNPTYAQAGIIGRFFKVGVSVKF